MKKPPTTKIPSHVPGGEIGEFTGVSGPNLSNKVAAGVVPKAEKGKGYPFRETIRALFDDLRQRAEKVSEAKAVDAARQQKADADRAEMRARKEAEDVDFVVAVLENWRAEVVKGIATMRFDAATEGKLFKLFQDAEAAAVEEITKGIE